MTELEAIFKKANLEIPTSTRQETTKTASKSAGIQDEIASLTNALRKLAEGEEQAPPPEEGQEEDPRAAAAAAAAQMAAEQGGQEEPSAEEILALLGQQGNPEAEKEVTAALKITAPVTVKFDKTAALDFVINKYASQAFFQNLETRVAKSQHEKTAAGVTEDELDEFAKEAFWQGLSQIVQADVQQKTAAYSQLNEIARYAPDLATALYTKLATEETAKQSPATSEGPIAAEWHSQAAAKTIPVDGQMVEGDDTLNEAKMKALESAQSSSSLGTADMKKASSLAQLYTLQAKIAELIHRQQQ